jgi:arylsulfatase A-like enzyme
MPTAAELSGGTSASNIDGVSIVPTLMGKAQKPKDYVYFTWPGGPNNKFEDALPEGWIRVQTEDGLLGYHHRASNTTTAKHPTATSTKKKKISGYSVRVGEWKGVVWGCADNTTFVPSDDDVYEIYHLASDPFEANDLAKTAEGMAQRNLLLGVLKGADVSCRCYQC